MAKDESRRSKDDLPAEISSKAQAAGGPPGDGSSGVWTDQYGRLCIGNECFHAAVDKERGEVRVIIDQSGPCGGADQEQVQGVVDAIKETVAGGAETVYQTKSLHYESKK